MTGEGGLEHGALGREALAYVDGLHNLARYLTGNTLFVDGGSHINGVQWDPGLPEE